MQTLFRGPDALFAIEVCESYATEVKNRSTQNRFL